VPGDQFLLLVDRQRRVKTGEDIFNQVVGINVPEIIWVIV
jgi:hypothetical protein